MRRSTIVFVLLFLVMAVAYYYFRNRSQSPDTADIAITPEPQAETQYLFSAEDGVPNRIRLEAQTGEVVELARDANAENAWVLKQPFEAAADQASSEAAATQVTTISITNTVPNVEPKDVGLDVPLYKLVVEFPNNVERIAEIGVLTPTENGYYTLKDGEIVIVNRSGIDALIGLLTNPPYAETLTPSPIPLTLTQTPLPSSTPEPGTPTHETATPTP
jgi:hypothetical protein